MEILENDSIETQWGDGVVIRATERAILVQFDGFDLWIPRSIIEVVRVVGSRVGDIGVSFIVVMPHWFVRKNLNKGCYDYA